MESGERIGRYLLKNRIGRGGMAEIFMAEESLAEGGTRTVAVKRLFPRLSAEREFVGMFVNEARIAASMGHPNIVKVYDLINWGSYYYIVMEYLEGIDLEELIGYAPPDGPALPVEEIAFVLHEVCIGLGYAHAGGESPQSGPVVHRDISPGNILIGKNGSVKITDFGIARALQYASFTRPGVLKGKYEYMAPEYVKGKDFDGRADLFSVGVVLYELLTRESPFAAVLPHDIWERIVKHAPPPPSRVVKGIPRAIDRVAAAALAKDPARRVSTGELLAKMLVPFYQRPGRDKVAGSLGTRVTQIMTRDPSAATTQLDFEAFLPPGEEGTDHTQEIHLDEILDLVEPVEVPQPAFGYDGTDAGTTPVERTVVDANGLGKKRTVLALLVLVGIVSGAVLVWALWPRVAKGYLSVTSDRRAEVFVDGKRSGLAPLEEHPVPVGVHTIEVRRPGRSQSKSYKRRIEEGKHVSIRVRWRSRRPSRLKRRRRKPRRRTKRPTSGKPTRKTRERKRRSTPRNIKQR